MKSRSQQEADLYNRKVQLAASELVKFLGRPKFTKSELDLITALSKRTVDLSVFISDFDRALDTIEYGIIDGVNLLRKLWLEAGDTPINRALLQIHLALRAEAQGIKKTKSALIDFTRRKVAFEVAGALYRSGAMSLNLGGTALAGCSALAASSIQFSFDPNFGPAIRRLERLAQPGPEQAAFVRLFADHFTQLSADFMASLVRLSLSVMPFHSASYSAPLTNTGLLASTIKVLGPEKLGVSRGRRGPHPNDTNAITAFTIGVDPQAGGGPLFQPPAVYGAALNLAGFTKPARPPLARIKAWARARGFPEDSDVPFFVARNIARRGVPGRAWVQEVLRGSRITPLLRHRVAHAFKIAWEEWAESAGG